MCWLDGEVVEHLCVQGRAAIVHAALWCQREHHVLIDVDRIVDRQRRPAPGDPPRLVSEKILPPDGCEHLLQPVVADVCDGEHLARIGAPHDGEFLLIKQPMRHRHPRSG